MINATKDGKSTQRSTLLDFNYDRKIKVAYRISKLRILNIFEVDYKFILKLPDNI